MGRSKGAVVDRVGSNLNKRGAGELFELIPSAESWRGNGGRFVRESAHLFESFQGRESRFIGDKCSGDSKERIKMVLLQKGEDQMVEIKKSIIKG